MDDILASIRRILNDEEKTTGKEPADGVLMLDPSMVVEETMAPNPAPPHAQTVAEPLLDAAEADAAIQAVAPPPASADGLVAPAAAAAAASSVGTLMRTLVAERNAAVHRGGPSIEDVVREEIRPLLKDWLDTHLPGMVERLVRAEIERVVGGAR